MMTGTALPQTILAGNANGLVYGVKTDDTVAEAFTYSYMVPPDVKEWQDIASICKSWRNVYGVKNDGTVAYVHNDEIVLPIDGWTDIASVTDSLAHVAGLRRDGTVITERISYDQTYSYYNIVEGDAYLHTESWKDIVAVTAGALKIVDPIKEGYTFNSVYAYIPYTVGLKADGTLVFAAEENPFPEAESWMDIVAITATDRNLLGLKADGTVVAAWDKDIDRSGISAESRARIEAWTDIVQVDCDSNVWWSDGTWWTESTIVGLKADGTVVIEANWVGDFLRSTVESWTDMVAVSADTNIVMGLRSNGSTANISIDYNQKTKTQNHLWSDIKVPVWEPIPNEPAEPDTPIEAGHTHAFTPATVGSPARCTNCGLMTGTSLDRTLSHIRTDDVSAVREDGTVVFTEFYDVPTDTSNRVAKWNHVASVNGLHGVRMDGTVLTVDGNDPVRNWDNIAKISDCFRHVVGLRKDGTVIAADYPGAPSYYSENKEHLNVEGWSDIVDVAAGETRDSTVQDRAQWLVYTVGLKSDGTLVIAAEKELFAAAKNWTNIVSIATDEGLLVGLKADGTVVYAADDMYNAGKSGTLEWTDIVQLDCCAYSIVGLKSDGTVVTSRTEADVSDWTDIVTVAVNNGHIYGLRSDGTVAEWNYGEEKKAASWTGIRIPKP